MKIASNTPTSFEASTGDQFVQLGDSIDGTSAIVLMLEKNWGSASIEKIDALTHWIKSYPRDIPCYLAGCEVTIPEPPVERYHHAGRDESIRALCDEVLQRSSSIGVRGELTYAYLTKVLGYDESTVDVMHKYGATDNIARLRRFVAKNDIPSRLEKDIHNFQSVPFVVYEKPINANGNILISKPYLTKAEGKTRLNADIEIDGEPRTLWCETDSQYESYLLHERADAFLCILLPFAMRARKNIICDAPVSEYFIHNLREILIPHLCAHDARLYAPEIIALGDPSVLTCGNFVATGMSCGIDSFYTVDMYLESNFSSMKLTHLYCGNYIYGNDGPVQQRAQLAADDLGLPLVRTATNINEALRLPHLFTHFFKTIFGVLAVRKLFKTYYYSTAEDFSHFSLKNNATQDTATFELLLLYTFTGPDFQLMTGGAKSERLEKTRAVAAMPTARKLLNVCLHPERQINCGKCGKCIRTLVTLDMIDALDDFRDVFNVDHYRENRLDAFVYLVQQKRTPMLSGVYNHFLNTVPDLIREAESVFLSK